MLTQKRHFFPKTKSDKLWLAVIIAPPAIYLIYSVFNFCFSYDGRCYNILDAGPECTLFEFIYSELTSPFFLPFTVLITLSWVATVGIIYFGLKNFRTYFKRKPT